MGVTKTDFVRGLQCEKMLWLDAHKPELKIIPPEVQEKLVQGNEFGDRAMGYFGEFVEVTTRRADGRLDFAAMLQKTRDLLDEGVNVICEAAFSWYGNYCAADILRKVDGGYELYEVKNTLEPREEFLLDLGFQSFLLRKCGVPIVGKFLLLNDGSDGCKPVEVTAQIPPYERMADRKIFPLARLKKQPNEPCVGVGEHCLKPYGCWYWAYCHEGKNND
jgi:hypothetical protein